MAALPNDQLIVSLRNTFGDRRRNINLWIGEYEQRRPVSSGCPERDSQDVAQTKNEHISKADSSAFRSGSSPKVNVCSQVTADLLRNLVTFATKVITFSTGCAIRHYTRCEKLTDRGRTRCVSHFLIHDVVRAVSRNTTPSHEQNMNRRNAAIRRRFVPLAFRFLTSGAERFANRKFGC